MPLCVFFLSSRRRSSSSSSRRRSSSSSTISGYSSDTQEREHPSSTGAPLSISQGTQPVSVITRGYPHSSLAPYHLLHNELHSAVPAMVDDALFTTLCEFVRLIQLVDQLIVGGLISCLTD